MDEVILNEINPIPGSMPNYLLEDFEGMPKKTLFKSPKEERIKIDYSYINSIQSAKG